MYTKVANGNISPSRFVKLDATEDGTVLQAGAGERVWGISQQGTRRTPYSTLDDGYAAIDGENLMIYGPGDNNNQPMLELGGTVTRGDLLKSDASGKGVTASADAEHYGAVAEQSGVSGDLIQVTILIGQRAS